MRRFLGIAAVAAALSLIGCQTPDRQARYGSRSDHARPAEVRPPSESLPNGNGPMRGDETFPSEQSGQPTTPATSGLSSTGPDIDRNSSIGPMAAPPSTSVDEAATGSDRSSASSTGTDAPTRSSSRRMQGRTAPSAATPRARTSPESTPPTSALPPDQDSSAATGTYGETPPIPNDDTGLSNPYDLGVAKSPRDGGMGASDGGVRFQGARPESETRY